MASQTQCIASGVMVDTDGISVPIRDLGSNSKLYGTRMYTPEEREIQLIDGRSKGNNHAGFITDQKRHIECGRKECISIELEDHRKIVCTPDCLIMQPDGTYAEASKINEVVFFPMSQPVKQYPMEPWKFRQFTSDKMEECVAFIKVLPWISKLTNHRSSPYVLTSEVERPELFDMMDVLGFKYGDREDFGHVIEAPILDELNMFEYIEDMGVWRWKLPIFFKTAPTWVRVTYLRNLYSSWARVLGSRANHMDSSDAAMYSFSERIALIFNISKEYEFNDTEKEVFDALSEVLEEFGITQYEQSESISMSVYNKVGVIDSLEIDRFMDVIGLEYTEHYSTIRPLLKMKASYQFNKKRINDWYQRGLYLKVVKREAAGKHETYSLSTGSGNYLANGVIVKGV